MSQKRTGVHVPVSIHNTKSQDYYCEEISSFILRKLKENVNQYKKKNCNNAVVTVPAYFTVAQREATKNAGILAGLNILYCLAEPTAAAISYGIHKKYDASRYIKVIVFDFGGGTLDVSLLEIQKRDYTVIGNEGNAHLGGEDIDLILTDFCMKKFQSLYNIKIALDTDKGKLCYLKLKIACEQSKKYLSSYDKHTINIPNLYEDKSFQYNLTKNIFNRLIDPIIKKCMEPLQRVMNNAKNTDIKDIEDIVLVGGSSRIPIIQEEIAKFFGKKVSELQCDVNPDLAIARGATLYAASMFGKGFNETEKNTVVLTDIAPMSLGVATGNGGWKCINIIQKGSTLPVDASLNFELMYHYQTQISVEVFEGDALETCDNELVGEFTISDIPKRKKEEIKIQIRLFLKLNNELKVTASVHDISTKKTIRRGLKIVLQNKLTGEQIKQIKIKNELIEREYNDKNISKKAREEVLEQITIYQLDLEVQPNAAMDVYIVNLYNWLNENTDSKEEVYKRKLQNLRSKWSELIDEVIIKKEPESDAEMIIKKEPGLNNNNDNNNSKKKENKNEKKKNNKKNDKRGTKRKNRD